MAVLPVAMGRSQAVRRAALCAAVLFSGFGVAGAEDIYQVDWTDSEGDAVSLRSEDGQVNLYGNGDLVVKDVRQTRVMGLSLEFIGLEDSEGAPSALTQVTDPAVLERLQGLMQAHNWRMLAQHSNLQQMAEAETPSAAAGAEGDGARGAGGGDFTKSADGPHVELSDTGKDQKETSVSLNHVLHLGRRTFSQTVLPSTDYPVEHWIVLFCYSWYEPCQNIANPYAVWSGEWEAKLNQDIFTKHVRFAKVDCATDKELCNSQDVDAYPFVKHYYEGAAIAKWSGGRSNDASRLVKWLSKQLGGGEKKPEAGEHAEDVFSSPPAVMRERGVNAMLVLGVLALTFRAVCLDTELWKLPTDASAAVAQEVAPPPPLVPEPRAVGPRSLPAEWARRAMIEL